MINPKKIIDKIKDDVMYYVFKHGTFDLKEMKEVNKVYRKTWQRITREVVIWVSIISINIISLIYIRAFINVTWTQCLISGILATYIMKKGFNKFIAFRDSINKKVTTSK